MEKYSDKAAKIQYVFNHMTAYGYIWSVYWEAAIEAADGDIEAAFEMLSEGCNGNEKRSINSALKKAGFEELV